MKNKIQLLVALLLTQISVAAPTIINGVKTNEFKPVVKLSIGSRLVHKDKDGLRRYVLPPGTCTGTFIRKDLILTAGHCLEKQFYEQADFYKAYISSPEVLEMDSGLNILINDEKVSRAQAYFINKEYLGYMYNTYNQLSNLNSLNNQIQSKTLDPNNARIAFQEFIKVLEKQKEGMKGFDYALIKVKPMAADKVYQVADRELNLDDPVAMVGYGYSINIPEVMLLQKDIEYFSSKYSYESNLIKKAWYLYQMDKAANELASKYGVKRFGYNRIEFIQEGSYMTVGRHESAKSLGLNLFPIYPTYGNKPNGKDVSASLGDSGGPLLAYTSKDKEPRVYGVLSMGGAAPSTIGDSWYTKVTSDIINEFINEFDQLLTEQAKYKDRHQF